MSGACDIAIPLDGVSLRDHEEWFHIIADLGFRGVWTGEVDGADGFTPLALATAWEPRLELGLGVAPVFTRGAGLLAMSIATLAEASEGRLTIGLGSSSLAVVQKWNGVPFEKPFARTRDVLRFVKRALDGEKIDESFETFSVSGFKLSRPVLYRPQILLAALRPRMLRLAGTEADGAILTLLSVNDVARCRSVVGDDKTLAVRLTVVPTENAEVARQIGRRKLSSYLTVEAYAEFHRWLGRSDDLQPMWDLWNAGDRKAANDAIPDKVVDEIIIHGSYAACLKHIQRYFDAGVQRVSLAIVSVDGDLTEAIHGLAPKTLRIS
jgi:probable F420-dependent oxidoreductase